jgi:hypothetical protein
MVTRPPGSDPGDQRPNEEEQPDTGAGGAPNPDETGPQSVDQTAPNQPEAAPERKLDRAEFEDYMGRTYDALPEDIKDALRPFDVSDSDSWEGEFELLAWDRDETPEEARVSQENERRKKRRIRRSNLLEAFPDSDAPDEEPDLPKPERKEEPDEDQEDEEDEDDDDDDSDDQIPAPQPSSPPPPGGPRSSVPVDRLVKEAREYEISEGQEICLEYYKVEYNNGKLRKWRGAPWRAAKWLWRFGVSETDDQVLDELENRAKRDPALQRKLDRMTVESTEFERWAEERIERVRDAAGLSSSELSDKDFYEIVAAGYDLHKLTKIRIPGLAGYGLRESRFGKIIQGAATFGYEIPNRNGEPILVEGTGLTVLKNVASLGLVNVIKLAHPFLSPDDRLGLKNRSLKTVVLDLKRGVVGDVEELKETFQKVVDEDVKIKPDEEPEEKGFFGRIFRPERKDKRGVLGRALNTDPEEKRGLVGRTLLPDEDDSRGFFGRLFNTKTEEHKPLGREEIGEAKEAAASLEGFQEILVHESNIHHKENRDVSPINETHERAQKERAVGFATAQIVELLEKAVDLKDDKRRAVVAQTGIIIDRLIDQHPLWEDGYKASVRRELEAIVDSYLNYRKRAQEAVERYSNPVDLLNAVCQARNDKDGKKIKPFKPSAENQFEVSVGYASVDFLVDRKLYKKLYSNHDTAGFSTRVKLPLVAGGTQWVEVTFNVRNRTDTDEIVNHEQEHATSHIIGEVLNSDNPEAYERVSGVNVVAEACYDKGREAIRQGQSPRQGETARDAELEKQFREQRARSFARAKNELFSMYLQSTTGEPFDVGGHYLSFIDGDTYDYLKKLRNGYTRFSRFGEQGRFRSKWKKLANEILLKGNGKDVRPYEDVLWEAMQVFEQFDEAGYTRSQAVEILRRIPLEDWATVCSAMFHPENEEPPPPVISGPTLPPDEPDDSFPGANPFSLQDPDDVVDQIPGEESPAQATPQAELSGEELDRRIEELEKKKFACTYCGKEITLGECKGNGSERYCAQCTADLFQEANMPGYKDDRDELLRLRQLRDASGQPPVEEVHVGEGDVVVEPSEEPIEELVADEALARQRIEGAIDMHDLFARLRELNIIPDDGVHHRAEDLISEIGVVISTQENLESLGDTLAYDDEALNDLPEACGLRRKVCQLLGIDVPPPDEDDDGSVSPPGGGGPGPGAGPGSQPPGGPGAPGEDGEDGGAEQGEEKKWEEAKKGLEAGVKLEFAVTSERGYHWDFELFMTDVRFFISDPKYTAGETARRGIVARELIPLLQPLVDYYEGVDVDEAAREVRRERLKKEFLSHKRDLPPLPPSSPVTFEGEDEDAGSGDAGPSLESSETEVDPAEARRRLELAYDEANLQWLEADVFEDFLRVIQNRVRLLPPGSNPASESFLQYWGEINDFFDVEKSPQIKEALEEEFQRLKKEKPQRTASQESGSDDFLDQGGSADLNNDDEPSSVPEGGREFSEADLLGTPEEQAKAKKLLADLLEIMAQRPDFTEVTDASSLTAFIVFSMYLESYGRDVGSPDGHQRMFRELNAYCEINPGIDLAMDGTTLEERQRDAREEMLEAEFLRLMDVRKGQQEGGGGPQEPPPPPPDGGGANAGDSPVSEAPEASSAEIDPDEASRRLERAFEDLTSIGYLWYEDDRLDDFIRRIRKNIADVLPADPQDPRSLFLEYWDRIEGSAQEQEMRERLERDFARVLAPLAKPLPVRPKQPLEPKGGEGGAPQPDEDEMDYEIDDDKLPERYERYRGEEERLAEELRKDLKSVADVLAPFMEKNYDTKHVGRGWIMIMAISEAFVPAAKEYIASATPGDEYVEALKSLLGYVNVVGAVNNIFAKEMADAFKDYFDVTPTGSNSYAWQWKKKEKGQEGGGDVPSSSEPPSPPAPPPDGGSAGGGEPPASEAPPQPEPAAPEKTRPQIFNELFEQIKGSEVECQNCGTKFRLSENNFDVCPKEGCEQRISLLDILNQLPEVAKVYRLGETGGFTEDNYNNISVRKLAKLEYEKLEPPLRSRIKVSKGFWDAIGAGATPKYKRVAYEGLQKFREAILRDTLINSEEVEQEEKPEVDLNETNYYKILGLDQSATEADVRKARRKYARAWHPDRNPGNPAAGLKYKKIAEAADVLSDANKRRDYDALLALGDPAAIARETAEVTDRATQISDVVSRMQRDGLVIPSRYYDRIRILLGGIMYPRSLAELVQLKVDADLLLADVQELEEQFKKEAWLKQQLQTVNTFDQLLTLFDRAERERGMPGVVGSAELWSMDRLRGVIQEFQNELRRNPRVILNFYEITDGLNNLNLRGTVKNIVRRMGGIV